MLKAKALVLVTFVSCAMTPAYAQGNLTPPITIKVTSGGGLEKTGTVQAPSLGLLSTCSPGQVLTRGVSTWACGTPSSGITNSAGNNVIPKSNGTNFVASTASDDGSTFTIGAGVTSLSGNLKFTQAADNYVFSSLATSSGNQGLNITAAGNGKILFQSGHGGIANAGTGGLELDGGGSSTTAVWSVTNGGVTAQSGSSTITTGGGSSLGPYAAGTLLTVDAGGGASVYLTLATTSFKGLLFANSSSIADGGVVYDATARGLTLRSGGNVDGFLLDSSHNVTVYNNATIGTSTAAGNHVISGRVIGTTTGFADGFAWSNAPTGAAFGIFGLEGVTGGTIDTTAAARNSIGVYAVAGTTRSAGSNDLVNYALFADASGGQDNRAIQTNNGNVLFTQQSGVVAVAGHGSTTGDLQVTDSVTISGAGTGNNVSYLNRTGQSTRSDTIGTPTWNDGFHAEISSTAGGTCADAGEGGSPLEGGCGVHNRAIYGNASGGDFAYSGYFDNGKFRVNGTSKFVGAATFAGDIKADGLITTTSSSLTIQPQGIQYTFIYGAGTEVLEINGHMHVLTPSDFDDVIVASSSANKGTISLSTGTGTATVHTGAVCTCTDTTSNTSVKCAVSSTTLTATGTGSDVIAYTCL